MKYSHITEEWTIFELIAVNKKHGVNLCIGNGFVRVNRIKMHYVNIRKASEKYIMIKTLFIIRKMAIWYLNSVRSTNGVSLEKQSQTYGLSRISLVSSS